MTTAQEYYELYQRYDAEAARKYRELCNERRETVKKKLQNEYDLLKEKAADYHWEAANGGLAKAQCEEAAWAEKKGNRTLMCHWLEEAAENGVAEACERMAAIYEAGELRPQDWEKAEHWHKKAFYAGSEAKYSYIYEKREEEFQKKAIKVNLIFLGVYLLEILLVGGAPVISFLIAVASLLLGEKIKEKKLRGYSGSSRLTDLCGITSMAEIGAYTILLIGFTFGDHPVLRLLLIAAAISKYAVPFFALKAGKNPNGDYVIWSQINAQELETYIEMFLKEYRQKDRYQAARYDFPEL